MKLGFAITSHAIRNRAALMAALALGPWLAAVPSARAWGPEGHRIVAHIAERRLSEPARAKLAALLTTEQQLSDNMICNWPDYIRHDRPETGPWHYVDIPYAATSYQAARDCPDGQCVVHQIDALAAVLADPAAPAPKRYEALCYVVHFVGDLHQPLHCADRDGDRGGNLQVVRYPGAAEDTNLHAVWDGNLLRANLGRLGPLEYADRLNDEISGRQARRWSRGTPAEWALEGHDLAVEFVYAGLPPAGLTPVALEASYITANRRLVARQMKKAGVRLAEVLDRALQ